MLNRWQLLDIDTFAQFHELVQCLHKFDFEFIFTIRRKYVFHKLLKIVHENIKSILVHFVQIGLTLMFTC